MVMTKTRVLTRLLLQFLAISPGKGYALFALFIHFSYLLLTPTSYFLGFKVGFGRGFRKYYPNLPIEIAIYNENETENSYSF